VKIQRALISISKKDQESIILARFLEDYQVEIYSSEGTKKFFEKNKIKTKSTSELTGFPEILGGRLKTLNAKVFAGILAQKNSSQDLLDLEKIKSVFFDLVVVDLYDFFNEKSLEKIDIGGVSLLRSAAKNYQNVVVLSKKQHYPEFISLYSLGEQIPEKARLKYATEAFKLTSEYDQKIYAYFSQTKQKDQQINQKINQNTDQTLKKEADSEQKIKIEKYQELRYGENPHQKASLFKFNFPGSLEQNYLSKFQKLQGKELSYNNWLDIDSAWKLINEFESEIPACSIIKHGSPCGMAFGENLTEAYEYALDCDPISAFGGIAIFNQELDRELALKIRELFLEIILAPKFSPESLEILSSKKNLRLIKYQPKNQTEKQTVNLKSICGNGLLVQETNLEVLDPKKLKVVTTVQPEKEDWLQLLFAFRVVKHLPSNATVIVNENRTVGISGGQSNRLESVRLSLEKASDLSSDAFLASDGFFPFADSIEIAAQSRIKAIIQPGGSIKDQEVIKVAEKYKIALVLTGIRAFKH